MVLSGKNCNFSVKIVCQNSLPKAKKQHVLLSQLDSVFLRAVLEFIPFVMIGRLFQCAFNNSQIRLCTTYLACQFKFAIHYICWQILELPVEILCKDLQSESSLSINFIERMGLLLMLLLHYSAAYVFTYWTALIYWSKFWL